MRSLSHLAVEYYQRVDRKIHLTLESRTAATKKLILKEVTRWDIKTLKQGNNYFFKPSEFSGTKESSPIEVRLIDTGTGWGHDLQFGDMNKPTDKERFKWNDGDPNRMSKALFVRDVLEQEVAKLLLNGDIKTVSFSPYNQDDMAQDRLSYFQNMFQKINKRGKFKWIEASRGYLITRA